MNIIIIFPCKGKYHVTIYVRIHFFFTRTNSIPKYTIIYHYINTSKQLSSITRPYIYFRQHDDLWMIVTHCKIMKYYRKITRNISSRVRHTDILIHIFARNLQREFNSDNRQRYECNKLRRILMELCSSKTFFPKETQKIMQDVYSICFEVCDGRLRTC